MTFVIATVNTHRTHTQAHKQTHTDTDTDTHTHTQTHRHTHIHTLTYTFTCTFNAATDNAQSTQTLVKYRCTWKSPNRLHLTTSTRWLPAYCSFYLEWDGWTDCFLTKLSMETGRDRSPRNCGRGTGADPSLRVLVRGSHTYGRLHTFRQKIAHSMVIRDDRSRISLKMTRIEWLSHGTMC